MSALASTDADRGPAPRELVPGFLVGIAVLGGFVLLRETVGFGSWTSAGEVTIGFVAPLLAGLVTGYLHGHDYVTGLLRGILSGIVLAVVGLGFVTLYNVVFDVTGNPVDFAVTSPLGHVVFALLFGTTLLPIFGVAGGVGGVVGRAISHST